MSRKWHPPNRDDFVREYLSKKSIGDIARAYGIDEGVAARYGRELGLVRPKRIQHLRHRRATDDVAIVAAYVNGMSELAVAKSFGIDRNAVRLRLLEAGVNPRGQCEAETLRWSKMTADQRADQIAAAHEATRGSVAPFERKLKVAATVEAKGLRTDPLEISFAAMLASRGVPTIAQQAIGPYNCDLGAFPVAVEIFGGNWHFYGRHFARKPQRFRYILDAGWHVLCIWINPRFPMCEAGADYATSYIEEARRDPSRIREYRVIRGAGEIVACGRADDDQLTFKPALDKPARTRGENNCISR